MSNEFVDGSADSSDILDENSENTTKQLLGTSLTSTTDNITLSDSDREYNTVHTENEINIEQSSSEVPFEKLDDSLLQLTKEAKSISVHPNYRLLTHFAWRQPVSDKNSAEPVRIAGGYDYQEMFEYNGERKLDALVESLEDKEIEHDNLSEDSELFKNGEENTGSNFENTVQETSQLGNKIKNSASEAMVDQQLEGQTEGEHVKDEQPILLPWVPEVDGSAKVYIYRNYLHVDTSLYFRKANQQEVDIYALPSLPNFDTNEANPTLGTLDKVAIEPLFEKNERGKEQIGMVETNEDSDFAWHYDDNFLKQDTEKVYTERLFNYPLVQTRRMRSTELHYFDHPMIGMLVVIRPYELAEESGQSGESVIAD